MRKKFTYADAIQNRPDRLSGSFDVLNNPDSDLMQLATMVKSLQTYYANAVKALPAGDLQTAVQAAVDGFPSVIDNITKAQTATTAASQYSFLMNATKDFGILETNIREALGFFQFPATPEGIFGATRAVGDPIYAVLDTMSNSIANGSSRPSVAAAAGSNSNLLMLGAVGAGGILLGTMLRKPKHR